MLFTVHLLKHCVRLPAAWQEVELKLEGGASGDSLSQGPIQYSEKTPSATMKSKCLRRRCRRRSPCFAAETSTNQSRRTGLCSVSPRATTAGPDKPNAGVSAHA